MEEQIAHYCEADLTLRQLLYDENIVMMYINLCQTN